MRRLGLLGCLELLIVLGLLAVPVGAAFAIPDDVTGTPERIPHGRPGWTPTYLEPPP